MKSYANTNTSFHELTGNEVDNIFYVVVDQTTDNKTQNSVKSRKKNLKQTALAAVAARHARVRPEG